MRQLIQINPYLIVEPEPELEGLTLNQEIFFKAKQTISKAEGITLAYIKNLTLGSGCFSVFKNDRS